ncbi:MAG TPA: hypothetical protein VIW95_16200 [Candidatus Binatus sp.]|uniref:hypothetical protein n=1 Tax=Candidatus Binatus sp. TaxID=2811406 RepID=UPI002F4163F8
MQSETFRSLVKPTETAMRVLRLAFLAMVPIYVCIAYQTFGRDAPGVMPQSNPLTIPLAVLSLVAAALAPYAPRLLLSDSRLRELLDRQPDPETLARDRRTGKVDKDRLARIKTLSPDEQRLLALVPAFFAGFIVRLAFNESIALYGLVLAFISRSFVALLPFAVVSLALNLMVSPALDSELQRVAGLGLQPDDIATQPR